MKQKVMFDTHDSRDFEYKNDKTYQNWVTALSAEDMNNIVAALHNYQRRIRTLEKTVDELIAEVKSLKHVAR